MLCSLELVKVEVGGGDNSFTLRKLRPFTTYNVSVLASTAVGAGPPATEEFTTEEAGEAPTFSGH